MDDMDRKIINDLQREFPVCDHPFYVTAEKFSISENELITRIENMLENGMLTRFGPLFNIEKLGGVYSLAAMRVPPDKFDETAEIINQFPQVAHNYEREHEFNLWFVLAADSPDEVDQVISDIEHMTGLHVYNMPKLKEYFVDLILHV